MDEISKNEGEVLCELRFLRTQYSKQLFESPIREENSRIEIPLFSHSSTLANIADCFCLFFITRFLLQRYVGRISYEIWGCWGGYFQPLIRMVH